MGVDSVHGALLGSQGYSGMEGNMNTIGVILSASCLLVSLGELRLRSDLAGRRMAAMLAAAAWATMGFVALDQNRQCAAMQNRQATVTIPAKQIIADALRDTWKYESPEGGVITFQSPAQAQSQLVGVDEWRVKYKNKL